MTLTIHRQIPASVFGLSGTDENDATYALGWCLEKCPKLRSQVLGLLGLSSSSPDDLSLHLQRHGQDGGFTDMEIRSQTGAFHVIIEAKRGWQVPDTAQMERYAGRLAVGHATRRLIVSLSAASEAYALRNLPRTISGTSVRHLSWTDIQSAAERALDQTRTQEQRVWLSHLAKHLAEYAMNDRVRDNRVYVVSLSTRPVRTKGYTWIDVVNQDRSYYHPVGRHWPVQAVNYIGFRYSGELQSVHFVEGFVVVVDVSTVDRRWSKTEYDHFVYRLGPPMRPPSRMPAGPNVRYARRVFCAIDTLLSGAYASLSDAERETRRRFSE